MNPDSLLPIGIFGGAIALALIGVAIRMMRKEREAQSSRPADSGSDPAWPAPASPARRGASPAPPGPLPLPTDGVVEILRVLRHSSGGLIVEIGSQRYTNASEIKDERHGKILTGVIGALQQFARGAASPPGPALAASSPAASTPPGRPAEAANKPDEPALQLPSMNPIKQMAVLRDRQAKKAREQAEAPPQTIVEQIEALLVKRLIGSPFDGRSIHMRPGLHGGAHIDVDGQAYESVEDVPDQALRQFIKNVVAEWEREQDPALKRGRT